MPTISETARERRKRIATPEVYAPVAASRMPAAPPTREISSARDLRQIKNRQEAEAMDEVMAPRVNARKKKSQ